MSLDEWLGEEVEIVVPTPTDNMTTPPRPNLVAIHYHLVLVGLQFPLHPLVSEFLNIHNVVPCQLNPNVHKLFTCFLTRCREVEVASSLLLFLHLFHVGQTGP
nr:uncharacterized protein LOC109189879 [Ipomoea trifida]